MAKKTKTEIKGPNLVARARSVGRKVGRGLANAGILLALAVSMVGVVGVFGLLCAGAYIGLHAVTGWPAKASPSQGPAVAPVATRGRWL